MVVTSENFLLIVAILLFIAVLAGKVAYRLGAPALLLFLGVGLFFGYKLILFDSPELTQFIGMLALCIILFSGGMDTKFSEIRPVLAPGIVLATAGVLLTARPVSGLRVHVPARAAARGDDVLDRLGIGLFDTANQETGAARTSATAVGVGERL